MRNSQDIGDRAKMSLHLEKGWGSQPPAWIETIASVHIDSKLPRAEAPEAEPAKAPAAAAAPADEKAPPVKPKKPRVFKLPMQVFTAAMAAGLLLSAFLGIAIALNNRATRRLSLVMLAAGTVIPIIVLALA